MRPPRNDGPLATSCPEPRDDVDREALHDWLDNRPPKERPDPYEYEIDEPRRRLP